jgi:excisionase family DNA binding protein
MNPTDNFDRRRASSVDDVAKRRGLGRTTIYREISAGRLKALKVGDRTIITDQDESDWLKNLRRATPRLA